jgi:C4-dicarboxylate-binding protein DctP
MALLKRIFCAAALVLAFGSAAFAGPQQIRVTLQLPKDSALYESVALFRDNINKELPGAFDFQIFPAAKLYKPNEVPHAVGAGDIEMGAVLLATYVETIPATDIFTLPFMFTSDTMLRAATLPESGIRGPIDKAILAATGARVLWWFSSGPSVVLSRGAPVLTPADVAKKPVRVAGASIAEMVKLCGATPVEMGGDQQYEAYKSGAVEIGVTALNVVPARQLWDVMQSVTVTNHVQNEFVWVINEKVWQALPPDQRKVFERAARASDQLYRTKVLDVAKESLELARQKGMKVYDLSEAQIKEWKACATPMLSAFLNKSGKLGQTVMNGYRQILVEAYRTPSR